MHIFFNELHIMNSGTYILITMLVIQYKNYFYIKYLLYVRKSIVIFQKEGEVLVGYINLSITTILFMLFFCVVPTRKCILFDL